MSDTTSASRSTVQSVSRAFRILSALRDADRPLSVLFVAQITGLDRTVVHRLLKTLALDDVVVEESGSYGLGPAFVLFANRYVDGLLVRRLALPYMLELQATVLGDRPWTATLSVPVGGSSTVIERIWTRATPLGVVLEAGDTFPMARTAVGRAMLAYYPDAARDAIVDPEDRPALEGVLDDVRASGIGLTSGEAARGIEAVGAAILSRQGTPAAALGVSGADLGDELAYDSPLARYLRRSADAIGQALP